MDVEASIGSWKSGLCSPSLMCWLGCYAPCFAYGMISGTINSANLWCSESECGSCCLYVSPSILGEIFCILAIGTKNYLLPTSMAPVFVVCCPLQAVIHALMRSAIRDKYKIPGSALDDCLIVTFCSCCAFSQVNQLSHNLQECTKPVL